LITTVKRMYAFKDDKGELMLVRPDTLLVPRNLEDTARIVTDTVNRPGTANNDTNPIRAYNLRVVVSDYLTDTNDWFVIDSRLGKMHLHWWDNERPTAAVDPTSDFNLIVKVRTTGRWSYGFTDWRWVYGNNVS
jgi:hypothetical protein